MLGKTKSNNVNNDAASKLDAKRLVSGMKGKLAACRKVTVKVPIDKQNPKDKEVVVQLNGYVFQITRGVEVVVPEPVKKLLERGEDI